MNKILKFISIIFLLIVIDFVWIGIINAESYKKAIKAVQKTELKIRLFPGLLVYIALALIIIFWILPSIKSKSFVDSFKNGFMLGALVYAVFDFTNMAIFSDWTYTISIIDTLWGGILTGLITYIMVLLD